jgi:hypothetical protein
VTAAISVPNHAVRSQPPRAGHTDQRTSATPPFVAGRPQGDALLVAGVDVDAGHVVLATAHPQAGHGHVDARRQVGLEVVALGAEQALGRRRGPAGDPAERGQRRPRPRLGRQPAQLLVAELEHPLGARHVVDERDEEELLGEALEDQREELVVAQRSPLASAAGERRPRRGTRPRLARDQRGDLGRHLGIERLGHRLVDQRLGPRRQPPHRQQTLLGAGEHGQRGARLVAAVEVDQRLLAQRGQGDQTEPGVRHPDLGRDRRHGEVHALAAAEGGVVAVLESIDAAVDPLRVGDQHADHLEPRHLVA